VFRNVVTDYGADPTGKTVSLSHSKGDAFLSFNDQHLAQAIVKTALISVSGLNCRHQESHHRR